MRAASTFQVPGVQQTSEAASGGRDGAMAAGAAVRSPLLPEWRHWLTPSLSDWVFCSILFWLFFGAAGAVALLADGDTGWHIRAGEYVLEHRDFPRQDLFSYSMRGEPWFAWEWLADVILAIAHQQAGLAGVVFLAGVLIAATAALLLRYTIWYGVNVLLAIFAALLFASVSTIHWLARPHLFTWIFLLAAIWLLESDRRNPGVRVYLTVPLAALWANIHGGFAALLVTVAIFAAGGAAEQIWQRLRSCHGEGVAMGRSKPKRSRTLEGAVSSGTPKFMKSHNFFVEHRCFREWFFNRAGETAWRWIPPAAAPFGGLLVLSTAATLLNPYGWELHRHIASYLKSDFILQNVQEFQAPGFRGESELVFEIMLLGGVLVAGRLLSRREVTPALLILAWGHASLTSVRHLPLFMLVAAPIVTRELTLLIETGARRGNPWLKALRGSGKECPDPGSKPIGPSFGWLSGVAAGVVAMMLSSQGANPRWRAEFSAIRFPAKACDALGDRIGRQRLLSTDQWGDYLIYRFYPEARVFLDGRSDFYASRVGGDYLAMMNAQWNWQQAFEKHRFEAALLPSSWALVSALKLHPAWELKYDDGLAVYFEKRGNARYRDESEPDEAVAANRHTRPVE